MGFFRMLEDLDKDIDDNPRMKTAKKGKKKKVGYKLEFEKGKKPIKAFGGKKLAKSLL